MNTAPLDNLCQTFRRRLRWLLIQAGLCRLLLVAVVLLAPLLVLDWSVHLATLWRCMALAAYVAALGATFWWTLLAPMRRPLKNQEIFACLDAVLPGKDGTLLELYELIQGQGIEESARPAGQSLVQDAVQQLTPLAKQAASADAFRRRRLSRWRAGAGVSLLIVAAAALLLGEHLSIGCTRLFNPFSSRRWPHRTTIALDKPAGGFAVPQLEPLEIRANITGVVPQQVVLAYQAEGTAFEIKEKLPVKPDGSVRFTFPEVRQPITFRIKGGDDTTDDERIAVIERPYLKHITAHYDYPDYAGLPNRAVEGGQLFGLEGTRVRVVFESSMALKKGVLNFQGKPPEDLPLTSPTTFEKSLLLTGDGSYSVELYEQNGFREAKPERYEIRVTPYNPPEVELLSPGQNLTCTPQAALPVSFRAADAFRLKKVQFLYQVGDAAPQPLTDRMTGPLDTKGKNLEARFTWDLRKMQLPATGVIQYFVRAENVNPTGRGITETPKLQIKLVTPSEFHFDTFEQAKAIEAEARLAWENQYAAWKLSASFAAKGAAREDDPLWVELKDKQEAAIRAATAMETAVRELIGRYEQNDMAREFMAGRLAVITELLRRVNGTEHVAIIQAFDQARSRTDADAAPQRLRQLRAAALVRCADNQKLAVLCLERMLKRLFDWRDLQTTLIRATLLHDELGEVLVLTQQIAPKTLGLEMEDLTNEVQDKLLTLGKRQHTLFDVEGELEKELEFQIYRAEMQKRRTILDPLRAAYKGLRDTRVNDNLKLAASKIENNQSFQIIPNQKAALQVLSIVKAGLIQAGQKVDPEETITVAMTPSDIIDVQPKAKTEEVATTNPAATEPTDVTTISPADSLGNLALGGDRLTAAINATWEAQDAVLARTRYLAENSSAAEMPRYVMLKQHILLAQQAAALRALERAITEAQKNNAAPVQQMLEGVREEMGQSKALIEAKQFTPLTQQIQADALELLDDLRRRFIPLQKAVEEAAGENKRQGGVDAFNVKYLLRDKDLDQAVAIIDDLNPVQLLERDVERKLSRFIKFPARDPLATAIEKANRARASAAQRRAMALLDGVNQKLVAFSAPVVLRISQSGAGALASPTLAAAAGDIDAAGSDAALRTLVHDVGESAGQALSNLKDLLGERERALIAQTKPVSAPPAMTLEQWQKLRTPEALRAQLKADKRLPADVREIMLRSLEKDFPPKYRDLLAAYYASFIAEEKKE